ncbi:histone-lysine N-methyltransferase, H3 lysine-79 specific-like isoform X2 [Alosa alosa]|uniref:histone-lysine N-methyltransferase, H3 lysine-79 specific-like isoform X2 n=1 Tax=Alosa alosa TaxID=278164 RepID=UPI0020154572|nr:histone-lysine N-methyltransferase, H3 lysine-79 specific-like isoform X2 [Alosa alosa]
MPRTQIHPEPSDLSSQESIWSSVIETSEESQCSSTSSGSTLEPVWELEPTPKYPPKTAPAEAVPPKAVPPKAAPCKAILPKTVSPKAVPCKAVTPNATPRKGVPLEAASPKATPPKADPSKAALHKVAPSNGAPRKVVPLEAAPPTQSRRPYAGTNTNNEICGCQVRKVQPKAQIVLLFPGHPDLGYRPTTMIRFPEVSPIHRASQVALPPLLSTQCQPAPRTPWNQSQTPTLQAPGPSDTAITNATEVSPESPHPQVAEITRKMDRASDLMDLIIVTRQRKLAELQILDLDVRGLPAKIKQMRRDHDYMIKAWERDRLQREADTMQLDGAKPEGETLAGVRDEVKTDAAALLLQQGSECTSLSCSSPVILHKPNQSEASQSTQAKCTLTNVKERDHNKSGAVACPLPNGWKHASRPPLFSGPCSSKNEGKDVAAQSRSSGLKRTSTFNLLSQNSLWSHGGQSGSDSDNSNCSSFQEKCTFPHKLISVPDLPLRDHCHEPPSTLICATSLAIVARRNGTQSPPARASMNNKEDSVEDEMTDSESEDSNIDQEEATGNKDDPTQRLKELQYLVLTTEKKLELAKQLEKDTRASYKKEKDQLALKKKNFQKNKELLLSDLKRRTKEELKVLEVEIEQGQKRVDKELKQETANLKALLNQYKKALKDEKKEKERQKVLEKQQKEEKLKQKKIKKEEEKKLQMEAEERKIKKSIVC